MRTLASAGDSNGARRPGAGRGGPTTSIPGTGLGLAIVKTNLQIVGEIGTALAMGRYPGYDLLVLTDWIVAELDMGADPASFTDADFNAALKMLDRAVVSGQIHTVTPDYVPQLRTGRLAACVGWPSDISKHGPALASQQYIFPGHQLLAQGTISSCCPRL